MQFLLQEIFLYLLIAKTSDRKHHQRQFLYGILAWTDDAMKHVMGHWGVAVGHPFQSNEVGRPWQHQEMGEIPTQPELQ